MEKWEYLMMRLTRDWDGPRKNNIWQVGVIAPDGAEPTKWSDAPAVLNAYGAQGGEFVGTGNLGTTNPGNGPCVLIFKRRKP